MEDLWAFSGDLGCDSVNISDDSDLALKHFMIWMFCATIRCI